jgi:hypothetical protein
MDIDIQELDRKKRFLKRYKKNLALIDRLESKVINLDERIKNIRSPVLSDMPRGGTPVSKEDILADKLEIEDRIRRLKKKGNTYKREIIDVIDELDDTRYAEILESFCIDCMTLEEIADDNGYTLRHIKRLYSEAILSVDI